MPVERRAFFVFRGEIPAVFVFYLSKFERFREKSNVCCVESLFYFVFRSLFPSVAF